MSSICAVSTLTLSNSNTTNGNKNSKNINNNCNNSEDNHSNESQDILHNLKLIKEKIESNGIKDNETNEVINNCFANGINGVQSNDSQTSLPINKALKIDTTLVDDYIDGNSSELYSEASTLSSSPVTSPVDECLGAINEALLEQKFSKLIVNDLNSPVIQITGADGFDEEEDDYTPRAPLLRSTSLKTGKTPPGTPHRKKIVRFADAMGLDLESVRHIISDDLPNVPQSAFGSLKLNEKTDSDGKPIPWFMQKQIKTAAQNRPNLMLEFIQPSSLLNFMDRVRNNKVCLDNCVVSNSAGNLSITCIIRVLNISFEKSVTLRYTLNEWLTFNEALASYIPNSCDGFSDKFTVTFSVSAGGYFISPGQRLLFALKYVANAEEYWDNNMGLNYSLIYRV
jgi:protein phosphatase 1 regulatory subunit 3A/B/C/D/E